MKPSIISIPASAASGVLKSLHVNGIDCNYMGLDQSGRILMEISYTDSQSKLVAELIADMEKTEKIVYQIALFFQECVKKQRQERLVELAELKKQYEDKKNAKPDLIP